MFALARKHHADRTGRSGDVQLISAPVSHWPVIGPPLAYALAMGFSFYGDVFERGGSFYRLRRHSVVLFTVNAKMRRWRPARWKLPSKSPRYAVAACHL